MSNKISQIRELRTAYEMNLSKEGGFLPDQVPLDTLPGTFQKYLDTCNELPKRYNRESGGVRKWMDRVFDRYDSSLPAAIESLDFWQKQKLMSVVSILAHTYRWDYVPPAPEAYEIDRLTLPEGIEKPFALLADLLRQPKCGTLWNTTISNWNIKDKPGGIFYKNSEIRMDNLEIAHNWLKPPLDEQLEKWVLIFTVTEARGAPVVKNIVDLVSYAAQKDLENSIAIFSALRDNLHQMLSVFNREVKYNKLDKNLWRDWIQPTFIWGLQSEEGRLEGASGLQLGAIQCVDVALSVEGSSLMAKAILKSRQYLPEPQRVFLSKLDSLSGVVREFVIASNNEVLKQHYNACILAMTNFRKSHRARGEVYMKGDHSDKKITTTGLSIYQGQNAIRLFNDTMKERMQETQNTLLPQEGY